MPSIYRLTQFKDQDELLYHKALLLMGDEKAKLIDIVRDYQKFYQHLFEPVINYLESYIEQSIKEPNLTRKNNNIRVRDVMEPLQLVDRLWWAMVNLMEVPQTRALNTPHLLPFSSYELRTKDYENKFSGNLPKW